MDSNVMLHRMISESALAWRIRAQDHKLNVRETRFDRKRWKGGGRHGGV